MNKYNLSGKVAIVTGGAQGFGLAITEKFIKSGAEVIIWDIDRKAINLAVKKIQSKRLSFSVLDITNFSKIKKK